MRCDPLVHDSRENGKTRVFGQFWSFSCVITHDFGVPGRFRCPVTPRYTTLERSAKLVFSAISGRFRGLYPMISESWEDFDAM